MRPGSDEWLGQVTEPVIDPDRPIIDPHHHLWPPGGALPYGLAELHADTGDGHRVEATVFVECGAAYRKDGPVHLRSVGETEFVAAQAAQAATIAGAPTIAGIVANADLRHQRDRPASSDELVEAQARYYHHTIDCFGPDRCMFESNFPVDRFSLSYRTAWNGFKKLAADFSDEDRDRMFRRTASRVYDLAPDRPGGTGPGLR